MCQPLIASQRSPLAPIGALPRTLVAADAAEALQQHAQVALLEAQHLGGVEQEQEPCWLQVTKEVKPEQKALPVSPLAHSRTAL